MADFWRRLTVITLALAGLAAGVTAWAEEEGGEVKRYEGKSASYRVYVGTVGEAVKMRLYLSRVGRDLDGYYYNVADRMPVAVSGEVESDGSLELTEYPFGSSDQSETTFGKFVGTLTSDGTEISGRWNSPQGERELRFFFREDYGGGVLRASLCQMSSLWESRRGDGVISREKGATFVQFEGEAPGIRRINAAVRAIVEGAFSREETARAIDLGPIGDRVTSATAPTLEGLEQSLAVAPVKVEGGEWDESDIRSYTLTILPVLNEVGMVCIRCYWDEYTGGAHPTYWDKYLTFDVLTGARLRPGDVFRVGHSKEVAELGAKALRRSWGLKPGVPLSEGATFEADLTLNENWFIHPGGIGYSYNPYEIGPYSAGFIRFVLPWSELREWIQPGSPVLRATLTEMPAGNRAEVPAEVPAGQ